ncbi:hypothetical protein GTQ40_05370 [Flavobacteriaceae bacterium R38]|nr:hypothetical protein [Flavobacteriaceae bacterium R38]
MKIKSIQERVFDALMDTLSIEELENVLSKKKQKVKIKENTNQPNKMTEERQTKEEMKKWIIKMGILVPPNGLSNI